MPAGRLAHPGQLSLLQETVVHLQDWQLCQYCVLADTPVDALCCAVLALPSQHPAQSGLSTCRVICYVLM